MSNILAAFNRERKTKNVLNLTIHKVFVICLFFFLLFKVSGPSMIPTFNLKGDGVIVVSEHLSSYFRTIKK